MIVIGANDVTHRVKPKDAVRHLAAAVHDLRAMGAEVIVGTCPDLGTIRPIRQPLRTLVRRMSRNLAAAQTITVVEAGGRTVSLGDLLGPLFASRDDLFSDDQFHPSAEGYAEAADALLPSVLDALGVYTDQPRRCSARSPDPAGRSGSSEGGRPPRYRGGRDRGARRAGRPARTVGADHPPPATPSDTRPRIGDRDHRRLTAVEPDGTIGRMPAPEAVIVATARSPIGRAVKGSLVDMRPDDLAATIVRAALDKVPAARPARDRRPAARLRPARRRAGLQPGPGRRRPLGYDYLPGATITRYCSSSLQTTRMAMHAIRAGEGDVFISAGVETVSRFASGNSDTWPGHAQPDVRRGRGAHRSRPPQGGAIWHDPREDGACPTSTSPMGQTAENLAQLKGVTREEHGRVRRARPRTWPSRRIADGFWAREITPVTLPDGTVVTADDGPRPGVTMTRCRSSSPCSAPTGTVTAGNCCPLNDGAAALVVMCDTQGRASWASRRWPGSSRPACRAVARDHGARPGRGVPAGARPRRA